MANHSSVSITKSISVYSNVSLDPPKTLVLSNLDRQCPNLMYTVFFYNKSSRQDLCFDSVFGRLRGGLEATLSIWDQGAGRLRVGDDGVMNILCNNGGAILVQAETQGKICELGDLFVYNDFFENLVFKPDVSDGDFSDMPLIVAQVTKFDCGGYSIGIGMSHALFDGISAFDFLRGWASLSQGRPLVHTPTHERGTLLANDHSDSSYDHNSNPTAIDHLYQLIRQAAAACDNPNQETNSLVYKTFRVSAEMIERLKKKEKEDKLCCSTFEVLAAHLWKVRTKSLKLDQNRNVCLQFAVDARTKTQPPLPEGFTGNAYVLASLLTTAGELDQQSPQQIINQIKEAKKRVNHDYVTTYMKALQGPNATLPPLPELTVVSDWTRLPFHKVDFFGEEAAYACPLLPPVAHVAYFMQNDGDCRAVDVRVGVDPTVVDEFSRHFIDM